MTETQMLKREYWILEIWILTLFRISIFEFGISREAGAGDVAQLGERRLCKPEVVGSSPIVSID